MKPFTYLSINLACIIIPLIASFYRRYPFYKEWKYYIIPNFIISVLFLIWDTWFTRIGVWGFNHDYVVGLWIYNLPIEEILFFFCIPYACVFTYFVSKKYIPVQSSDRISNFFVIFLLVFTAFIFFIYHQKMYTSYTALFLFLTIFYVWYKRINIRNIFLSYLFILPFFFLSNGILTGSFVSEPIVWYNDLENVNLRIFTIPVEDAFYGFLLVLLNILFYEYFKKISIKENKEL